MLVNSVGLLGKLVCLVAGSDGHLLAGTNYSGLAGANYGILFLFFLVFYSIEDDLNKFKPDFLTNHWLDLNQILK